jgi:Holliday junction DNA helicase RuvB
MGISNMFDSFLELLGMGIVSESIKYPEPIASFGEEKAQGYLITNTPKKFIYRPQTLEEYIGQENAKSLVRLNLEKIVKIKPVHILISGDKGHGKTTLAYIIGKMLNLPISYSIGGSFTFDTLKQFLTENETDPEFKPHILFIDEIHGLEKTVAEFMYPMLEDFILPLDSKPIRPFILIGATTEKYSLLKKYSPMVDRCACQIELESYKEEDIYAILKQYNRQIYNDLCSNDIFSTIARNCKFTPRISIAFFDDYIVCKDINRVLKAHRIVENGLTDTDLKILTHLKSIGKPVGEEALSMVAGVQRQDYRSLFEPFLLKNEYISRTCRGRIIAPKGLEFINKVGGLNEGKL